MFFTSTRSTCSIESASAIAKGLADDGGLFVPESFPVFSESDIAEMLDMDYQGRAVKVLSRYLTDFSAEEIHPHRRKAAEASHFFPRFRADTPP